jgi:uncharacterized membrane protein
LRRYHLVGLLTVILLSVPLLRAEETFSPITLEFTIYSNGVVEVDYTLETDSSMARIEVPLFGEQIESLVIRDDEGFFLDSTFTDTGVRVDTLGAMSINITYMTSILTAKAELIWTFNVTIPIQATIRLPLGALIFDISEIPLDLKMIEGRQHLTMGAGNVSICYVINLPDIREEAAEEIENTRSQISQIESQGVVVTQEKALLEQAEDAYIMDEYLEAKQLATQAGEMADATFEKAVEASEMIESAAEAIDVAREEGRTVGLSDIEVSLQIAIDYYSEGRYTEASNFATRVYEDAVGAEIPVSKGPNLILIIGSILGLVGVVVYILNTKGMLPLPSREKEIVERPPERLHKYDVERIFEEHPSLRMDDKEVIRFVANCGGEAFANEVRNRFDLPRSSAWRLLRRITQEGIFIEEKVENQSLYRINERYRESD